MAESVGGFASIKNEAQLVALAAGEVGLQYSINARYPLLAAIGHQRTGRTDLLNNKSYQATSVELGFLRTF